jgi:predicted MFS family arabinose efflux permease
MAKFAQVSAAGFAATAVAFGPGRMGFGLFLPEFRASFALSSGTAGLVSGLGFFGFFIGLVASYALTAGRGPRFPVVLGLLAAALGAGLVAVAQNLPVLAAGVFLVMSSAGFSWAPFNNAVHREIPDGSRPLALSVVSTGTSLGVAAAGVTALLLDMAGYSWRIAWAAFAAAGLLAALANAAALRDVAGSPGGRRSAPWRDLVRRSALPLYGIAFSFGTTTSVYVSFAADRIAQAGGLPGLPAGASPSLVFIAYGILGLAGIGAGRARQAAGLARLLRFLFCISALSHLLVALAPTTWTGAILSAGLQGLFVMTLSAVLSFWSERLFPALPSLGFTAALLAVAGGSVLGPGVAGFAADMIGPAAMFLGTAAISGATASIALPRNVRERAAEA